MSDRNQKVSHRLSFWLSSIWIILTIVCALCAGLLPLPEFDHMDWNNMASPPGTRAEISSPNTHDDGIPEDIIYLLGTDTMGRDILTRLIFGARISLIIGLSVPAIGLILGTTLGMLAGYYRGKVESIIMAVMDTILAFPGIVLMLAITFSLGPGVKNLVIALGILVTPTFSRVARANTLKFAQHEFILASRMIGHTNFHIMLHELLPNIIIPICVYALMLVGYIITAEGMLSFLGLGVPAPIPSWGGMIAQGKEVLDQAPFITLIPSFIMFLTILSFNLLGDSLRCLIETKEIQL